MKNNIKRINQIFQNNFTNNLSQINRKLYPKPYFLEEETTEDGEPILFI
ncbi:hypothetical protein [Wenyingzhuangia aestuarii]|nr:hypothetical protein [Wenyingzhuangia aestuarii]NJB81293.1 hypothetical protein [Wenyingzhuangia aestuarii]